ncbi:hypothetical protein ABB02_00002 [Clostridiaceae bacterium JG1575]|nr:hypothetical protein ABB02_00002 [Clostridiaceae bacterium JG1575]
MATNKPSKLDRILSIYTALLSGETLTLEEIAERFACDPKTVRREFTAIEDFLADHNLEEGGGYEIVNVSSSRSEKGAYRLLRRDGKVFSRGEIMAISKILMDSRALTGEEMKPILNRLVAAMVLPKDQQFVKELLRNEWFHYISPSHGKPLIPLLLELAAAIKQARTIRITYVKGNGETVGRILEPLGIIFSEYYFYLAGNIKNIDKEKYFQVKGDENPTMYRVDRIESVELLDERYTVQEAKRFKEGEYRQRIQFMFGGPLHHLKLLVKEFALQSIKDHLPTAKVSPFQGPEYDYLVEAELFGDGILIWLMGQGDGVKLVDPPELVEKLKRKARHLLDLYQLEE